MKKINIVNGPQNISAIIQGCMRMPALTKEDAAKVIRTAYDCGVNYAGNHWNNEPGTYQRRV